MNNTAPYKKLCTQFYDLSKPHASAEETAFYSTILSLVTQPILEAMCGSGRLLIPLLQQGFIVDGVDNSTDMLESCKKRCFDLNLKPNLYLQNIEHLALPRLYGAIIIAVGSFQLITDKEKALAILQQLRKQLIPNGILILDTFVPDPSEPTHETLIRTVARGDGLYIQLTSELDKNNQTHIYTSINHYELMRGNDILDTEDEIMKVRWYSESEMKGLLQAAGFHSITEQPASFDQQQVSMYIAYA